ncbi:MAG: hypothetical protein NDF52_00020 [archaeon YNP-WB-062]|jgi:hypothetical protein|nr:hypothetical protein [Candidatus Culexarchaeum yellowstonense]
MISWNEERTKIFMLSNVVPALKRKAESASREDLEALVNEYARLREFLISIYPDASRLLPRHSSLSSINDVKYAIDQLVNCTNAIAMPLFIELLNYLSKMSTLGPPQMNPLSPIIPILDEWSLSTNWAVGASALALIEVIVNKKLEELKLGIEGDFRTRFNRLLSKAKEKGIQLPDLLADPFYQARNKLLHGGKEPTPEELKLIFDYLNTLSASLRKI